MIRSLTLINYRSFAGEHTLPALEKVNVFVGPNALGKSNILSSLIDARGDRGSTHLSSRVAVRHRASDSPAHLRIQVRVSKADIATHIAPLGDNARKLQPCWAVLTVSIEEYVRGGKSLREVCFANTKVDLDSGPRDLADSWATVAPRPNIEGAVTRAAVSALERVTVLYIPASSLIGDGAYPARRMQVPLSDPSFFVESIGYLVSHADLDKEPLVRFVTDKINSFFSRDIIFTDISYRPTTDQQNVARPYLRTSDGYELPVDRLGSAVATTFRILCAAFISSYLLLPTDASLSTLICVEEPDHSMHPDQQTRFLSLLCEVVERFPCQFFVTTHSPFLLTSASSHANTALFSVKRNASSSHVIRVDPSRIRAALEDLGSEASTLLQARRLIWCEGPSDARVLRVWLERTGRLAAQDRTAIAQLGGTPNAIKWTPEQMLAINTKCVVWLDSHCTSETTTISESVKRWQENLEEAGVQVLILRKYHSLENLFPYETFAKTINCSLPKYDLHSDLRSLFKQHSISYCKDIHAEAVARAMNHDDIELLFTEGGILEGIVTFLRDENKP